MAITIDFKEKDIEDFLCSNNNLRKRLKLEYIDRQVEINGFYIDILAYDRYEKCFYIIELKKENLNSSAFVQAMKYLRLMQLKYKKYHKFKILLIGQQLDEDLHYIVEFFDPFSEFNYFYALFAYDFERGIDFNWYNKSQRKIENNLREQRIKLFKEKQEVLNEK